MPITPVGTDQDAGVEQPRAVALEQPEDAVATGAARRPRSTLPHLGAVDRDGMRQALVAAGEAVAREGALGEDRRGAPRRRPPRRAARGCDARFSSSRPSFGSIWTAATR